jgi:hypothetical protein
MQATEYTNQVILKKGQIAKAEMSLSFRQNRSVNSTVSNIISTKKAVENQPIFLGNAGHQTTVRHYTKGKFRIPNYACTILSTNLWFSFHVITQLHERGAPYKILQKTRLSLQSLIPDAIRYKNYGKQKNGTTKPRISHIELTADGSDSWSELVEKTGHGNGLLQVSEYLEKTGITEEQALEIINKGAQKSLTSHYTVGLINDAKSLEMNRVVLTPEINTLIDLNQVDDRMLNTLYTGVTRGKFELVLPDSGIFFP